MKNTNLILIDGHALAFRQYFALERTAMSTKDNVPTWAVFGFFKAIFDLLKGKKVMPDAIAVAFDVSKKTFRYEKYKEYKANRKTMPDNLRIQMSLIMEGLKAFNIPVYTKEGFEADDIIGTISKRAINSGHKTYILTGDQDAFQLIDKDGLVKVMIPYQGKLIEYGWEKVYEKLGVYPNQVIDYKALRGDVSDNIPGIKGIGEKTAQTLLKEYGNLENILDNCENIEKKAVKTKLCEGVEDAKLSKFLATIDRDVDIDFDIESAKIELPDISEVTKFLQKMQFNAFIKNIDTIMSSFNNGKKSATPQKLEVQDDGASTQLQLFSQMMEEELTEELDFEKTTLNSPEQLKNFVKGIKKFIAVKSFFTSEDKDAKLKGVAFAYEDEKIKTFYIPVTDENVSSVIDMLKPVFEDDAILKTFHNAKLEYSVYKNYGVTIKGLSFDTMLASYVKDPSRDHSLSYQAFENLNLVFDENKKNQDVSEIAFESVYSVLTLTDVLKKQLDKKEMKIIEDIELPLSVVLSNVESAGVSIDKKYLRDLTKEFEIKKSELKKEIIEIAGKEFNINSHRQVGEALYEMGIKQVKKKGKFSTTAQLLEELSEKYEICAKLLLYRKYSKLITTYTESLPELVSPVDNKIHTSYNQINTATGRLSSSNPNLQNIPIRTEEGNKIRKAFIPSSDENVLLSADYSQIELRLLAHCSKDENLVEAFNEGKDVHAEVASKIFDVPISEVTKDMRRKAKRVNFGLVYGQTKYGLAKSLSIAPFLAQVFIDKYFEKYPKVKEYMQNTVEFAKENGYVETIFGRKRYFHNTLNSSNVQIREAAGRAAINQPLQGSAADLIKIAMISLFGRLTELKMKSKIIMQVHDELIIETPKDELERVTALVKETMELNQPLCVPLEVNTAYGNNWVEH